MRTGRRSLRRKAVAFVVAAGLATAPLALSGFRPLTVFARAAGTVVHTYTLAPGVTLRTYHFATGPEEVRVVTLVQGAGAFDVVPAGSKFGAFVRPSTIASSAYQDSTGTSPALAATNGDFATRRMPVHLQLVDGEIWSSGLRSGQQFAMNSDGSRAWIGRAGLSIAGTYKGSTFAVDHWNAGAPTKREINAYTSRGGSVQRPPSNGVDAFCALRLLPTSGPAWSDSGHSRITRSYTVSALNRDPCPTTAMSVTTQPGAVVLATKDGGSGATFLATLQKNDPVRLAWDVGHPGAVETVGGTPLLVDAGVNVGPPYRPGQNYVFNYNPRTSIGISSECGDTDPATLCKIFLVTVDGRQKGWSTGWRFDQLGEFFANKLHAAYAMNLDGGGGTVMFVDERPRRFAPCTVAAAAGCLVTRPSDSTGERGAVVALVILPGADAGLPPSLR